MYATELAANHLLASLDETTGEKAADLPDGVQGWAEGLQGNGNGAGHGLSARGQSLQRSTDSHFGRGFDRTPAVDAHGEGHKCPNCTHAWSDLRGLLFAAVVCGVCGAHVEMIQELASMVAFVTLSAVSVTCLSARVIKPRTSRLYYRCTCRRSCPHHACARKAGKAVHALAQCHLSTMHNCAVRAYRRQPSLARCDLSHPLPAWGRAVQQERVPHASLRSCAESRPGEYQGSHTAAPELFWAGQAPSVSHTRASMHPGAWS
jgi:hypothetical protein